MIGDFQLKVSSSIEADIRTRNGSDTSPLKYMRQLDGLRAFAVFAVLVWHFVPKTYRIAEAIPWGVLGVQLFFVISGFLISGILVKCRSNRLPVNRLWALRQFYIRRFLRIFPLYYFVLALVFLLDVPTFRETSIWYLTYLSNFLFFLTGHWADSLSHFWSLAVEEQFYWVWPLIILFTPRRGLAYLVLAAILVAPFFRWIVYLFGGNGIAITVLTPSNMDALGMGALLAILGSLNPGALSLKRSFGISRVGLIGLVGAIGVLLCIIMSNFSLIREADILFGTFLAMFFGWLVYRASCGFNGPVGSIFSHPAITYLGKISYGIYVYHNFIPPFVQPFVHSFALRSPLEGIVQVLLSTSITVLVASISWFLFEKPLSDLRKYFDYKPPSYAETGSARRVSPDCIK